MRKVIALSGVVLLVALYIVTLILAIFKSPATKQLFLFSAFATVFIPILLYIFVLFFKYLNSKAEKIDED